MGCLLSILRRSKSFLKRYFPRRHSTPVFFEGPARRQYFALPDPIMYYIAKNVSNAKLHRKFVLSCKYFFIKNPVIVIPCVHYNSNGWSTCIIGKKGFEKIDMEKISTKFWLCDEFPNHCHELKVDGVRPTLLSFKMIIPKFYRIDSSNSTFKNNTFIFEEVVCFGSPKVTKLKFENCIIQYENGEPVQLETLVAQFPLLQQLSYTCRPNGSDISVNTVKKLLSIPNFSNMQVFQLLEIPDSFDIESLFEYLKSRDNFHCLLNFRADIAADYRERIEAIIDELLSTESTSFRVPFIQFPNMHPETKKAFIQRFKEDYDRCEVKLFNVSF